MPGEHTFWVYVVTNEPAWRDDAFFGARASSDSLWASGVLPSGHVDAGVRRPFLWRIPGRATAPTSSHPRSTPGLWSPRPVRAVVARRQTVAQAVRGA